jgi:hypothetical protein
MPRQRRAVIVNSMSPCPTPNGYITGASAVDVRVKETDTALQDVTPSLISKNVYSYDRFNNVTETDQYGFYGYPYRKNMVIVGNCRQYTQTQFLTDAERNRQ